MNTMNGNVHKRSKMKVFVFFVSLCLLSLPSSAQKIEYKHSNDLTNQYPQAYWSKLLGQDDTGFYMLRQFGAISNESIILEKYSPTMELMYSSNIESTSGVMGDSKLHRLTKYGNGKVYVFLEGWNKSNKENSLILKEVGNDGKVQSNEIFLEKEPGASQMKSATYNAQFSADGSKLAVWTQKPYQKGMKESVRVQVFNTRDFSSLWKQELVLDNEDQRAPKNYFTVSNDGTVHVLKDIQLSWKENLYSFMTISATSFASNELSFGDYKLSDFKMQYDVNGSLIIAGAMSMNSGSETDKVGTWLYKLNPQNSVVYNKVSAFDVASLNAFIPKRNTIKTDFVVNNLNLNNVLIKPNGEVVLLLENFSSTKAVIGQAMPPVYNHTLNFGNVLILSFDASGNKLWHSVIEKNQKEDTRDVNCHFGSFAACLLENELHIVWNFMELQRDPIPNSYRYWVDRNGSKINIDNLYGKNALFPTLLTVIDANGAFVYNERTFNSLPLDGIQKVNSFSMAVAPVFIIPSFNGFILMSHTIGTEAKRYKFSKINF
jgi:hypothetical protein